MCVCMRDAHKGDSANWWPGVACKPHLIAGAVAKELRTIEPVLSELRTLKASVSPATIATFSAALSTGVEACLSYEDASTIWVASWRLPGPGPWLNTTPNHHPTGKLHPFSPSKRISWDVFVPLSHAASPCGAPPFHPCI